MGWSPQLSSGPLSAPPYIPGGIRPTPQLSVKASQRPQSPLRTISFCRLFCPHYTLVLWQHHRLFDPSIFRDILFHPLAMHTAASPRNALFYPTDSWYVEVKPSRKTRTSCTKYIERQVIRAWKRMTGVTRRRQQSAFLPNGFILVTSRRRSVMFA